MKVAMEENHLLELKELYIEFETDFGRIHAVNGISLAVPKGKTVAIVGESGCGKTVTALSILRLLGRGNITRGQILYNSEREWLDLSGISEEKLRLIRGKEIAMIHQEPKGCLNPVLTIETQMMECIRLYYGRINRKVAREKILELLLRVGFQEPESVLSAYPHQLSGGMCQRVMIAMAISGSPKLIIADEPTTALDPSLQGQIMSLLNELKDQLKISLLLITHDFSIVEKIADEIIVLYGGRIVEKGDAKEILTNPMHPYTVGLLKCRPSLHQPGERIYTIPGQGFSEEGGRIHG